MNALVADPGIASQILTEHRAGLADAQSAIQHARRAGELLLEAREQCERGEWLPWLTAHCLEIPERTASRYMQIARSPELEAESVREAILKLASPRKPNNSPRVAASLRDTAGHRGTPADTGEAIEGRPPETTHASEVPERLTDQELAEEMEIEERQYQESIQKVMEADDAISAAHAEIKRQAAEIAGLKVSRDGFMNGKLTIIELLKAEQAKTAKQSKLIDRLRAEIESLKGGPRESAAAEEHRSKVEKLEDENERLRERLAIMEETA